MQEGDIPASTALPDKLWARKYMQGFKKAAPAAAPKPAPAPVAPPEAATPELEAQVDSKGCSCPSTCSIRAATAEENGLEERRKGSRVGS